MRHLFTITGALVWLGLLALAGYLAGGWLARWLCERRQTRRYREAARKLCGKAD